MDVEDFHYDFFGHDDEHRNVAEEHHRRVVYQVNLRLQLRDIANPFAISLPEFMKLYRLDQHHFMQLVGIIAPYLPVRSHAHHIPIEIRVLCAIFFYACGSYQRVLGRASDLSVSQASVSNLINEVTQALNHPVVLARFIHFPATHREREETMQRNALLGMPRVLGFIDGTLIKIVPPSANENREAYYCRKGYPAINCQIVSDASLRILDANARFPGGSCDPFIYRYSGVREAMIEAYRESRCWLLGDSAYPHEPWLHTPINNAAPGTPEADYTDLHCHCRNASERTNGVLKERWRCLLTDRTLHYRPVKAGLIINACCVLHNFCVETNIPEPQLPPRDPGNGENELEGDHAEISEEDLFVGRRIRQRAQQERAYLINYAHNRRRRM